MIWLSLCNAKTRRRLLLGVVAVLGIVSDNGFPQVTNVVLCLTDIKREFDVALFFTWIA